MPARTPIHKTLVRRSSVNVGPIIKIGNEVKTDVGRLRNDVDGIKRTLIRLTELLKKWHVFGVVFEQDTQNCAKNASVTLFDRDGACLIDDPLGTTNTDENGCFALSYKTEDFSKPSDYYEENPDLYFNITWKGKTYTTKDTIRCNAGRVEFFRIALSKPNKLQFNLLRTENY